MPRFRDVALFAVSGLLSAAIAGILVVMLALCAVGGPLGLLLGLIAGMEGVRAAVVVAGLPAILIGGFLWSAGAEQAWARLKSVWAAIGALAGIAGYAAAYRLDLAELRNLDEIARLSETAFITIFALAGAGAALAFRASMKLLLLFLPDGPA